MRYVFFDSFRLVKPISNKGPMPDNEIREDNIRVALRTLKDPLPDGKHPSVNRTALKFVPFAQLLTNEERLQELRASCKKGRGSKAKKEESSKNEL